MTNTRQVNAALKRQALPVEFVGTREGYHYFVTDSTLPHDSYSVYTCYVSDLTVDQWVGYAKDFMSILAK